MRPTRSDSATEQDGSKLPTLWHHRDFMKFWAGESLSLLGTQVTALAVPLMAIDAFNASDELVGFLRFLELVPYIGLALLFGVWVDRVSRLKVMLWTNVIRMVLVAAVPIMHWTGVLSMPILLVIALAIGIASVLFDVSWMPFVPALVTAPEHHVEANAKMGISQSVSYVAGPGIAGLLIALLTAPVVLIVDAFSYLASIVSLMLIRAKEPPPAQVEERHLLRELRAGLDWVFRKPILRWLAIVGFCCNFSMQAVWIMFLLYSRRELDLSPSTIGLILAIGSVGGLIGAMLSTKVIKRFPLGKAYFVAQTGLLLGPVMIVLASGPTPVVIAMLSFAFFTTNLGLGVANVIIVSVRQTSTPHAMMSRMTACFRTLLFGGGALGGLTAGLLVAAIGAKQALVVAAIASAGVVFALMRSPVSRLRELPPAAAEPQPVPA